MLTRKPHSREPARRSSRDAYAQYGEIASPAAGGQRIVAVHSHPHSHPHSHSHSHSGPYSHSQRSHDSRDPQVNIGQRSLTRLAYRTVHTDSVSRASAEEAINALFEAVNRAMGFFYDLRKSFERDICEIKVYAMRYASHDLLAHLWIAKIDFGDRRGRGVRGDEAREERSVVDLKKDAGFSDVAELLCRRLRIATTVARACPSTHIGGIAKKLEAAEKDVDLQLQAASRRVQSVELLMTELELLGVLLERNGAGGAGGKGKGSRPARGVTRGEDAKRPERSLRDSGYSFIHSEHEDRKSDDRWPSTKLSRGGSGSSGRGGRTGNTDRTAGAGSNGRDGRIGKNSRPSDSDNEYSGKDDAQDSEGGRDEVEVMQASDRDDQNGDDYRDPEQFGEEEKGGADYKEAQGSYFSSC